MLEYIKETIVVCLGPIVRHLERSGGIPPAVKWRPLADMACSSGAIWRIYHALVAPPGGQVTN